MGSTYLVFPRERGKPVFAIPSWLNHIHGELVGRHAGLAAGDAKKWSEMQKPLLLSCVRPTCKRWADMRGWPPEMQKMFLHRGQPLLDVAHVGPAILLFYCFAILLLYYSLHVQYCRGRCLGLAARDAKSLFASRTATLRCRPRTTTYNHILPRTTAERSFCISDSHPCVSALLFYCFTIFLFCHFTFLLLYYLTQHTVLPRRCLGFAARDAKRFCIAGSRS